MRWAPQLRHWTPASFAHVRSVLLLSKSGHHFYGDKRLAASSVLSTPILHARYNCSHPRRGGRLRDAEPASVEQAPLSSSASMTSPSDAGVSLPSVPEAAAVEEDRSTHERLRELLTVAAVPFKHTTHAPVRTSEQAAQIRGALLHSGAKAMFMIDKKSEEGYLLVMSAVKKADWKLIKAAGFKNLRMATEEEVKERTGCIPGAVPPFGSVFPRPAKTLMDLSIREQGSFINFNAGLRTDSFQLSVIDYEAFEKPLAVRIAS